ncbi:MAG: 50S ribosomal protein L23 [Planctomycetes bacterium]|nr:50S ribosomal protein L23 [Planctomycetota bacterium]
MPATEEHYRTIVRPVQTEKAAILIGNGVYTFEVSKGANKHQIAAAVEAIWEVKVKQVRVFNTKGEERRNKMGRYTTKTYRKALVTLAEGFEIEVF